MVPIKEAHSWVRGVRKERQRCVCGGRGRACRRRPFSTTWILCLCCSLCAGCVGGKFSPRHNEVQTKRRVFYHNSTFRLPAAAALNVPSWPAMHTEHSFLPDSRTEIGLHGANRFLALQCATLSIPEPAFHFHRTAHHLSGYFAGEICRAGLLASRWMASKLQTWRVIWWSKTSWPDDPAEILLGLQSAAHRWLI